MPINVPALEDTWQNATLLEIEMPISFTIDSIDECHWYKIMVILENQTLKASLNKLGGGMFENPVNLEIYNEQTLIEGNNTPLYIWDEIDGLQSTDFNYKLQEAGIYYLKVDGEINLSPLTIEYALILPDENENNDTWENATVLLKDSPAVFTLTAENDEDWYKLTIPSGEQMLKITIYRVDGEMFENPVNLEIYDEQSLIHGDDLPLYFLNGMDGSEPIDFNCKLKEEGTYYLRIYGGINLDDLIVISNLVYSKDDTKDEEYDSIPSSGTGGSGGIIKDENVSKPPIQSTQSMFPIYDHNGAIPGISFVLPVDKLAGVTDKSSAVFAIQSAASDMTVEQKNSATCIDLITLYAEEAVAQAASTIVSGGNIVINESNVIELQTSALDIRSAAVQTLDDSDIITVREMNADIKFKTETSDSVKITVDPSTVNITVDNVRVETPDYVVTFSAEAIKQNAGINPMIITITEDSSESVLFTQKSMPYTLFNPASGYNLMTCNSVGANSTQLAASNSTKTYTVSFNKKVNENVKVSLPPASGDPIYQAITNSGGMAVGGKYNPVNGKLEAQIKESDTYIVKQNKKSFADISGKSKEMQEAILVLSSKGIINGTSTTTFSPDGTITRAEIAALIVRTLSRLDSNANGGFIDVSKSDWYYGAVGSAKKCGIINGIGSATFAPKSNIRKDAIVAICARTLRLEMKYKDPTDVEKWLSGYTDRRGMASWGLTDFALATRENLVVKRTDGKFNGNGTMTRGDASIILYRMFNKIW